MPSNIIGATPVDVFPGFLTTAFNEQLRIEANINTYADGSSDRSPLAANPRRFWKLTTPLTASQWNKVRAFYFAHVGTPFFFYALRETIPPWTVDPTGQSTAGRYTVVFDGAYSENIGLGRSNADFGLREVG
jgi:hypothetical protein